MYVCKDSDEEKILFVATCDIFNFVFIMYVSEDSDEEDKGDTEALLDELLGSGRRVSHRQAAPSPRVR